MKSTLSLLIFIAALYFYTASSNAAELTFPFGLPEPPEARLAISDVFDSAGVTGKNGLRGLARKHRVQTLLPFIVRL